ncbi:histidine triad nucleotide-binding protein [Pontibacterium granulatum]|uniref:histidine triad nucleotide-binding protein n=1 Tax=Pontibacterium granulatum TaxID=2036029 RepID=UPI00249B8AE0|nr:histidine triad nucleotide-binding protein [Pontibacterium granulatum]MDI3326579.1 histidine triad nucleotide-binding protein [Pontibacterium granulatum]
MDCIFCKIIAREIPANIAYEDDRLLAFHDISPQAPSHVLIIPKHHIATLNDLNSDNADLISHMVLTATKLADEQGLAKSGYRLIWNCNEQGGQDVFHIHLHLLGGRAMHWPPG